jgi:hypothetical protein
MVAHAKHKMSLPAWSISLERLKIWAKAIAASTPYHALSANASYLDG